MWVKLKAVSLSSTLSFLLIGISLVAAAPRCYDTGNFTTNSTYAKNRDLILASLPPNASANGGFFTTSVGLNSDQVYALAMCRGDFTPDDCYSCVNSSIYELMANCPNQKEASSWTGDYCVVHYADRSIFGTLELDPTVAMYNTGDITSNLTDFDTVWQSLINNVVSNASNGSSSLKYATGEADFGVFQRIYSQVQCTPDLSQQDCDSCLRKSASDYVSCCNGKQGGVIQKPNCYFRWDLYPFYVAKAFTTAPECYETGNFTTDSTYGKNRDLILASLPPNVSANGGFLNATIGQNSNKVYAVGMCRGDSLDLCSTCLNFTIDNLIASCPNQLEALSWGGDFLCLVHYANRKFYGILERDPVKEVSNYAGEFTLDLTEFDMVWESLMVRLVTNASNGSSSLKYATGEANITVSQKIYTLMQCTPDLSQWDCNTCLRVSADDYKNCCHGKGGGYVKRPNCIFRWDLNRFYVYNASTAVLSLTPPSTPGSSPPIITKDEQKTSLWVPLGASLSAALGLALLSACVFFIWRRRNIQEDKEDSGEVQLLDLMVGSVPHENSSENFNLDNVGRSQGFPSMQFDILQAATNSFCDENKLGQGGFGPVYKLGPCGCVIEGGYMAPEYAMEGLFSVKSDVFSFGVLLLEIISGKRNSGFHSSEYGESLLTFAWKLWSKGEAMKLIEEHLVDSSVPTEVLKCIQIGLLCVQADPVDRPTMSSVVAMLVNDTITLPQPAEPAFYVRRFVAEPIQPNSSDRICSINEVTISNMSPR
ncbi:hypothetical protein V6N13_092631 [Hibiscus sabdariffa]